MLRKEFVDILTSKGFFTINALRTILKNKDPYIVSEFNLLESKSFNDVKLAKTLAKEYRLSFVDNITPLLPSLNQNAKMMHKRFMQYFRVIPVGVEGEQVVLLTFDPTVISLMSQIRQNIKKPIIFKMVSLGDWQKLLKKIKISVDEIIDTMALIRGDEEDDRPLEQGEVTEDIIQFVNRIFAESLVKGASDIHIEPYEGAFRIRIRIDGVLIELMRPPLSIIAPVVSRIKIMADMDIGERRRPQDGRIKMNVDNKVIDFRISIVPTLFGEKVVLRILDASNLTQSLDELGFEKKQITVFKTNIKKPYGMCLVTGPTGSGKTTTLYSALKEINLDSVNISTIEDPVEYNIEGVNQINVKKDIGLDFSVALRSFLRQDPDIIMVGEIRDRETAQIATQASLTGHMVLTTLHTNDSASAITRLLNIGVEPFLVVAALNMVVAQRLCRKICSHCRVEDQKTLEELIYSGFEKETAKKIKIYKGQGCEKCYYSGYHGRCGIYEILVMDAEIKKMIIEGASSTEIKTKALQNGMKTLRMSALTRVVLGITTLEEAIMNSNKD